MLCLSFMCYGKTWATSLEWMWPWKLSLTEKEISANVFVFFSNKCAKRHTPFKSVRLDISTFIFWLHTRCSFHSRQICCVLGTVFARCWTPLGSFFDFLSRTTTKWGCTGNIIVIRELPILQLSWMQTLKMLVDLATVLSIVRKAINKSHIELTRKFGLHSYKTTSKKIRSDKIGMFWLTKKRIRCNNQLSGKVS